MKARITKILTLIIVVVILAASFTGSVSVFAADTVIRERVYVDFEDGTLIADSLSSDSDVVVSDNDPINGNKSLDIYSCNINWANLELDSYNMSIEFKFRCTPDFAGKFDLYIETTGSGESNKRILSLIHQNNVLSLVDSSGATVQTFSYNTVYKIKAEIQRGNDSYSIYVNDTRLDSSSAFSGKVFSVESVSLIMNESGSNSFISVDDFRIYGESKSYPQQYSSQKPGKLNIPEIETDKDNGMSLYINSTKIYFANELFTENNTVYIPGERLFESVGMEYTEEDNTAKVINENLNLVFSADSNIATINGVNIVLNNAVLMRNGVMYVPLNLVNEALNGYIWWDEVSELVVITTGSAKSDNLLKNIDGKLFMNGKPYYEISFLYENLLRDIWKAYENNPDNIAFTSAYSEAREVLSRMSSLGFSSVRTYFFDESRFDVLQSEESKASYFKSIDIVLDLCDEFNIRVVPCLGLNSEMYLTSTYVNGYGWALSNDNVVDMVSSAESASRKRMLTFLSEFVNRYRDRTTILMWELCDGANLSADCGATNGDVAYSLLQLSEFYKECADCIREVDSKHLISGGDGLLRTAQWHLLSAVMNGENEDWTYDDSTQRLYALSLLTESFDILSVHGFNVGVNTNAESFYADENGAKVPLTFSYLMEEADALGKILYNGATNGAMDYSSLVEGQTRYLESIVESGVQLSYWQLNEGEALNTTFFNRNSLSKAVADANTVLNQRYVINKAATENTNTTWTDLTKDIFDPEKIDPGNEIGIATTFIIGIVKVVASVVITVLLIFFIIYFMHKTENSRKRSKRKNG